MGEVVGFDAITKLDLPAEKVLSAALTAELDHVIVIGWGTGEPYHASTTSDIPELIFRLEMFKRDLIDRAAGGDNG